MKGLSVVGTAAMFLVGGGIIAHGIGPLHHAIEGFAAGLGGIGASLLPTLLNAVVGLVVGFVLVGVMALVKKARA
jgi:predicted DNA repair protein MutK